MSLTSATWVSADEFPEFLDTAVSMENVFLNKCVRYFLPGSEDGPAAPGPALGCTSKACFLAILALKSRRLTCCILSCTAVVFIVSLLLIFDRMSPFIW